MATCHSPSSGLLQMEYERRSSSPLCSRRKVRYCPCVNLKISRSSAGTSSDTTTLSGVSCECA